MKESIPPGGFYGFGRHERLKKRGDIDRVFRKGRSVGCPGARLFYIDNGLDHNRIVFTFVRKYGNAVERNRARRLGREAYRLLKRGMKTGRDLALLAYPPDGARPGLEFRVRQFRALITKAGL